jgi:hypothetical protein
MAENKPTNRERLREITDGIEQGIKELFESEKYMRYLSVMSRFHRYSVNNTMLIYMQKPDATLVAGYNKWKDQFERHVKKGEHGITIIAPTPYKKKIEEQKLDPDTKAPILDKDGKIVTEEKEIEIPMKILKCLLMIVTAPVVLVLTLFVWFCTGLIYISGLVLGLLSTVIALLGVAVLITYSPQNGVILLVMAFLISPMGLPLAAIWLLGKVQSLKFAIQDWMYG